MDDQNRDDDDGPRGRTPRTQTAEPAIKVSLAESLKRDGKGTVPATIDGGRELADGSVNAIWRELTPGERLVFNKDSGEWAIESGGGAPQKVYLTGVAEFLQFREGGIVRKIIVKRGATLFSPIVMAVSVAAEDFPDVRVLNDPYPEDEWELNKFKTPKPPWSHERAVYFTDPVSAAEFTYCSNSWSAEKAFRPICRQIARKTGCSMSSTRCARTSPRGAPRSAPRTVTGDTVKA